jgi:hypothetical protein
MKVVTKKHQLTPKIYRRICMRSIIKKQWWLPLALFGGVVALNILLNLTIYRNIWIYFFAILGPSLWYLFWWIQFTGAPHLTQLKPFFEKFIYEFSSKDIILRVNQKEGVQLKWENIQSAEKTEDAFILYISVAQIIHLPFKIFQNENDLRFMEKMILERKNLLKSK